VRGEILTAELFPPRWYSCSTGNINEFASF
jgi:hypothetical protein